MRKLAWIAFAIGALALAFAILKPMMGDASAAAERIRLQNEVYKIIEYVRSQGDLPRDSEGRFDPSVVFAVDDDLDALVFNPLLTAESITNPREVEVLAATAPAYTEPDFEDPQMRSVQFIMTDGSAIGRRVDPDEYSRWCEVFARTDAEDKQEMEELLRELLEPG